MPYIRETILTTVNKAGKVHIAPLGIIQERDGWVIAPFRPSTTLDNLAEVPFAIANYTDDARIFAGCLTGRKAWPTTAVEGSPVPRLEAALAHSVLEVVEVKDDKVRPRHFCRIVSEETHAPFTGMNRAKAAVLELAILVSRLNMLPREKIEAELTYLRISIDKTAGPDELEAWNWLMARVDAYLAGAGKTDLRVAAMRLELKRVYDAPDPGDGLRILVDRLWPRGLGKAEARVDLWAKDVAPSTELRRWFGHDQAKWTEFQRRYRAELDANDDEVDRFIGQIGNRVATLLYAAHDEEHNNAVALRDYLKNRKARGA